MKWDEEEGENETGDGKAEERTEIQQRIERRRGS